MELGIPTSSNGSMPDYGGRTTLYILLVCILAASGGLMFGYDIGISGGVTAMDDFQLKFFPDAYAKKQHAVENAYCKYINQKLQAFTSSLYIAGLVSSFFVSWVTKKYGRKATMLISGLSFLAGVGLSSGAVDVWILIAGRVAMGWGISFANQAVPLYLSEMAPAKWRGGLNILFQLACTIGILIANLVNYDTDKIANNGWRVALGLAAVPALLLTLGGLLLPDTPMSLITQGNEPQGRKVLEKLRGTTDVDVEFRDIVDASKEAELVKNPFQNILKPRNLPQLVISVLTQIFQQLTGIIAVMFYAALLFQTMGFGSDSTLYSAVITGAVNVLSTIVSIVVVDRLGRRVLLREACVQMFASQVAIALVLALGLRNGMMLSHPLANLAVILICFYVMAFAWSRGPLGWLIPSEMFTYDTRSAGQSITVSVNLLCTFLIAQFFLSMLCGMKWGIFIFFAMWVAVMQVFVWFFLTETKGVPIERWSRCGGDTGSGSGSWARRTGFEYHVSHLGHDSTR